MLRRILAYLFPRRAYRQAPPLRNPRYLAVHVAATSKGGSR